MTLESRFAFVKMVSLKGMPCILSLSSILDYYSPTGNYIFKVNSRNTRTRYEVCSKLKIKTPEPLFWSLLLTLNIFHTLV